MFSRQPEEICSFDLKMCKNPKFLPMNLKQTPFSNIKNNRTKERQEKKRKKKWSRCLWYSLSFLSARLLRLQTPSEIIKEPTVFVDSYHSEIQGGPLNYGHTGAEEKNTSETSCTAAELSGPSEGNLICL